MSIDLYIDRVKEVEQGALEEFIQLRKEDKDFAELYALEDFEEWYSDIYMGGR
jgi:hypothetical protein